MLIGQLIEILKGYDRELYIHTLKGETVQDTLPKEKMVEKILISLHLSLAYNIFLSKQNERL